MIHSWIFKLQLLPHSCVLGYIQNIFLYGKTIELEFQLHAFIGGNNCSRQYNEQYFFLHI